MITKTVSIIDIGTNSIKLLVANTEDILYEGLRGVRIGEGIGEEKFIIKEEVIQRNITAIKELFNEAQKYHPDINIITGTSAVRDALNAKEFCARVKTATGVEVRIMTGEEEALTIAEGVATDPNVNNYNEFCLFDLGGGSLECIHYKEGKILSALSLPLGIVRLTEKYISNPKNPVSKDELQQITNIINENTGDFPIKGIQLVGSGGALSAARHILKTNARLNISDLKDLLAKLSAISMEKRITDYGIPPFRADLMPTALTIIIALSEKSKTKEIIHSPFSLRFGLLKQILP